MHVRTYQDRVVAHLSRTSSSFETSATSSRAEQESFNRCTVCTVGLVNRLTFIRLESAGEEFLVRGVSSVPYSLYKTYIRNTNDKYYYCRRPAGALLGLLLQLRTAKMV
jgi:hypothetical protein